MVDVDKPLVSETYICGSKESGAFTVCEGMTQLRVLYAQDIEGFDCVENVVEHDKRAREMVALMAENFMVCLVAMYWLSFFVFGASFLFFYF